MDNNKVLLTGASGFLGQCIKASLEKNHIDYITLGRSCKNNIRCDLSNEIPDLSEVKIDRIIHAAGKAHVIPKSKSEVREFFDVNVKGTIHILKALEKSNQSIRSFIYLSSVSVYGIEQGQEISEQHPLLATNPYGKSKIEAEKLITEWTLKHHAKVCILRLPLIAGKNAPGNLGAMVRGIASAKYLSIGAADAKKSIVLASDIGDIIPLLFSREGTYNFSDGYNPSFGELEMLISKQLNKRKPVTIPVWFAKFLGFCGDLTGDRFPINSRQLNKILLSLTFSDKKARKELNWNPNKVLDSWKIN